VAGNRSRSSTLRSTRWSRRYRRLSDSDERYGQCDEWTRAEPFKGGGLRSKHPARALIQSKRLDRWLVDRSRNKQTLITLIIRQGGTRLYAERTGNRTAVVTRLLQCHLNIHNYLVGKQITVSVDRPVVIVIAVERIVTPGRIPIASIEKIVCGVHEND